MTDSAGRCTSMGLAVFWGDAMSIQLICGTVVQHLPWAQLLVHASSDLVCRASGDAVSTRQSSTFLTHP